ncbi:MAG TPA: hypothetical protein VI320_21975 [Terracidiphilus sp.]
MERLREQLERRNQRIAELEKQVKEQQKKIAEEVIENLTTLLQCKINQQ